MGDARIIANVLKFGRFQRILFTTGLTTCRVYYCVLWATV